jgi:hypothetical protein
MSAGASMVDQSMDSYGSGSMDKNRHHRSNVRSRVVVVEKLRREEAEGFLIFKFEEELPYDGNRCSVDGSRGSRVTMG